MAGCFSLEEVVAICDGVMIVGSANVLEIEATGKFPTYPFGLEIHLTHSL